jgi:hypothetical protein
MYAIRMTFFSLGLAILFLLVVPLGTMIAGGVKFSHAAHEMDPTWEVKQAYQIAQFWWYGDDYYINKFCNEMYPQKMETVVDQEVRTYYRANYYRICAQGGH